MDPIALLLDFKQRKNPPKNDALVVGYSISKLPHRPSRQPLTPVKTKEALETGDLKFDRLQQSLIAGFTDDEKRLVEVGLNILMQEAGYQLVYLEGEDQPHLAHDYGVLLFPPPAIPVQNASLNNNFGARLEDLKQALLSLSEYLRGIDDTDVLSAELIAVRSYIDASLCFFDEKKYLTGAPEEVPGEIANGVKNRLENADWSKTSSEARGWVQIAIKFFTEYFKSGGS